MSQQSHDVNKMCPIKIHDDMQQNMIDTQDKTYKA